jgi:hypothetical protein
MSYIIGLDPGVTTGYALWEPEHKRFYQVSSMAIHEAMACVKSLHDSGELNMVVFEDARLRKWFAAGDARQARSGAGIREGVGSVKRDAGIWADYLGGLGVPYKAIKPAAGATKWTAEHFSRVTGWTARTNEHGRDAAVLVFGMKPLKAAP